MPKQFSMPSSDRVIWWDQKNSGKHRVLTVCYDEALSGPGIGERPGAPQGGVAELTGDEPEPSFLRNMSSSDRKLFDSWLVGRDSGWRRAKPQADQTEPTHWE